MAEQQQLSLSAVALPPGPTDLPPSVAAILHAARSLSFTTKIVRSCWGVGIGVKRRWTLMGDCCCALSAYLLVEQAAAGPGEGSPRSTVARLLGLSSEQVTAFVHGFDGRSSDEGSEWYRYGARVAREVVVDERRPGEGT